MIDEDVLCVDILPWDKEESPKGTLILDVTCTPQNISYPQDVNLLNEARMNLEEIIDTICYEYNYDKPRTYRKYV